VRRKGWKMSWTSHSLLLILVLKRIVVSCWLSRSYSCVGRSGSSEQSPKSYTLLAARIVRVGTGLEQRRLVSLFGDRPGDGPGSGLALHARRNRLNTVGDPLPSDGRGGRDLHARCTMDIAAPRVLESHRIVAVVLITRKGPRVSIHRPALEN
jgi:hypothetical protein